MQEFIDYLLAYTTIFGLSIQNWVLAFALIFVIWIIYGVMTSPARKLP